MRNIYIYRIAVILQSVSVQYNETYNTNTTQLTNKQQT